LVFDNAESVEDLIDFVPRSGVGHVIITSRRGGWEGVATSLDVDVMREAEAVALPCGHVPGIDTGVAASVAELLGRLPLAVEQAAAYLRETGMPPEAYLRLLETRST
jgi:hypothetical protein